ncbi:MAG: class I SAM-dependent methyltransferase [Flavobacteriales bacterium]|nr:class I SAM-dependent methyltransferase [Flavobacteriales bacterium]
MNFLPYNRFPTKEIKLVNDKSIASFLIDNDTNFDEETVKSFGDEWLKFNLFSEEEIKLAGNQYFDLVGEDILNKETIVLDLGCGSGRWTKFISKKVKIVEAIDPSDAIISAANLNKNEENVRITQASVSNIPFEDESFDFVICLGVLHHIPNTSQALIDVVKKIKTGGSILLYLYYNLDNRGMLYKYLFKISTVFRLMISKLPHGLKKLTCDIVAVVVYLPLVLITRSLINLFGTKSWIKKIPLSYYSDKSFNIIRNDALDRFGTPLEQRFSKIQIEQMMLKSGLTKIVFSDNEPYWHVLGTK